MCLWSPCCLSPVHAEEEPPVQPAEGGHCVVHGELQRLRQRQVSGCQGSAQGLGAGRLCSECCCVLQLSGTNYHFNDGCWCLQLIVVGFGWSHRCLRIHHLITKIKYHICCSAQTLTVKQTIHHYTLLAFLALAAHVRMKLRTLMLTHFEVYRCDHNVAVWFNRNLLLYCKVCITVELRIICTHTEKDWS